MRYPAILYRGHYVVPDNIQMIFRPGGGGVSCPRTEDDIDVEAVYIGGEDISGDLPEEVLRGLELDLLTQRSDAYADHYFDQREDR